MQPPPFRVLCLAGGGFKGLYTAQILHRLEEALGEPVGRHFDMICGTSIGSILALAVSLETPMSDVVELFICRGPTVFVEQGHYPSVVRYFRPYPIDNLSKLLVEAIPGNPFLRDVPHDVLIPAVNMSLGKPVVFRSRRLQGKARLQVGAIDAALASSSLPGLFPLYPLHGHFYADGGFFATTPELVALEELDQRGVNTTHRVRMLSIGATTSPYRPPSGMLSEGGLAGFLADSAARNVLLTAQEQFTETSSRARLGENYLRVNTSLSAADDEVVGPTKTDRAAIRKLLELAERTWSENSVRDDVLQFLSKTQVPSQELHEQPIVVPPDLATATEKAPLEPVAPLKGASESEASSLV